MKMLSSIPISSGRAGIFSLPGFRRLIPDQLCQSGKWRFIKHENGDVLFCHNDFPFHIFDFFSTHKHLRQIQIPGRFVIFDPLTSFSSTQEGTGLHQGSWDLHGSHLNHRRPHSNDHQNEYFIFRKSVKEFSSKRQ